MKISMELTRRVNVGSDCVLGDLTVESVSSQGFCRSQAFKTLELPWRNNARMRSCIPLGSYLCVTTNSIKFGFTLKVLDVKGRTGILFHAGNWSRDTSGCILVGMESFVVLGPKGPVGQLSSSQMAKRELMSTFVTDLGEKQYYPLTIKQGD